MHEKILKRKIVFFSATCNLLFIYQFFGMPILKKV